MSRDKEGAVEMFNSDKSKDESVMSAFTSKVYIVDENDDEDPDIDMDLTIGDINRAFVSPFYLSHRICSYNTHLLFCVAHWIQ
jgi:hypothetical protein